MLTGLCKSQSWNPASVGFAELGPSSPRGHRPSSRFLDRNWHDGEREEHSSHRLSVCPVMGVDWGELGEGGEREEGERGEKGNGRWREQGCSARRRCRYKTD